MADSDAAKADPAKAGAQLSKSARRFQGALGELGLDLPVVELPDSARTADDAAAALGCAKAQIVKSLVFRDTATGGPVLVLASGPNRVDEDVIAAHAGAPIAKADARFVKEATGWSIGGVPPLAHRTPAEVYVDEDLLRYDEVWAAAGTPRAVFRVPHPITAILGAHTLVSFVGT